MAEGIWTPEKKRWKHLELEFIPHEQTPKEGINHLDEIRIRFIVCLSFIKLNWWQAMDFSYYLFFLKRIEKRYSATLRRSSWTTGRIGKNEWIYDNEGKIILNEPPLEFENDWWKRMNHREELEGKYAWWDLDTREREELDLIKEHLNEAPG